MRVHTHARAHTCTYTHIHTRVHTQTNTLHHITVHVRNHIHAGSITSTRTHAHSHATNACCLAHACRGPHLVGRRLCDAGFHLRALSPLGAHVQHLRLVRDAVSVTRCILHACFCVQRDAHVLIRLQAHRPHLWGMWRRD